MADSIHSSMCIIVQYTDVYISVFLVYLWSSFKSWPLLFSSVMQKKTEQKSILWFKHNIDRLWWCKRDCTKFNIHTSSSALRVAGSADKLNDFTRLCSWVKGNGLSHDYKMHLFFMTRTSYTYTSYSVCVYVSNDRYGKIYQRTSSVGIE